MALGDPRRFRLIRDVDVTGVSGPGHVADGVMWSDGTASVRWLGEHGSIVFWGDMESVNHVHGHDGRTRIKFLDPIEVVDTDTAQAWLEGSDD